jgi:Lamin Tail Domain
MRKLLIALGIAAVTGVSIGAPAALASAAPAARTASSPIHIHEIYYNSPGKDTGTNASLNAEWVQLHNSSAHRVTLTHWTLRDRAGHLYKFGTYRLKAHGYVKIHTGKGSNTQTNRYWGHSWYIWNNNGDRATLKNANGTVIDRCAYSDPYEKHAYTMC